MDRIPGEPVWKLLEDSLEELSHMGEIETIRMLEGRLAFHYWDALLGIQINWRSKDIKVVPPHWKSITERMSSLSGTTARHATNPFHAILNYAYGMLEAQVLVAINASGLDPACGYLHVDRIGRNSLVFDLMEPHRPRVDRLVLSLFEKTIFSRGMFSLQEDGEVRLSRQFARYVASTCKVEQSDVDDTVNWMVRVLRG